MSRSTDGQIPVLKAEGKSLAEMWENSVVELWHRGCRVQTEYDKDINGKLIHPPSVDCTMVMTCLDPASEPAIHRAFPGGLDALEEYRLEVVEGVKDHWTGNPDDPDDHRWRYTYHQRLTKYGAYARRQTNRLNVDGTPINEVIRQFVEVDQLLYVIEKLSRSPYSRRALASTWMPWCDPLDDEPPCLQNLWCRILEDEAGLWHLNMNVLFRSRDAFDAAFMNCWAFGGPQGLQGWICDRVAERAGRPVVCGRYCDTSWSYHIYGKRVGAFEESVIADLTRRPFEERTWTSEFAQPFFDEARPRILEKIRAKDVADAQT